MSNYISEWVHSLQIAPFDPTKKKKKKKVVIQDPTDDSVDSLAEKTENLTGIRNEWLDFPMFFFL